MLSQIQTKFYALIKGLRNFHQKPRLIYFLVFLVIILGFDFLTSSFFLNKIAISRLKKEQNRVESIIQFHKTESLKYSEELSNDPILINLLSENKFQSLLEYGQNVMVQKGLTYLTVTDKTGNVIVRTHRPNSIGDNIFESIPNCFSVFQGENFSSISSEYSSPLLAISGSPIKDANGKIAGAVFSGYELNDSFIKNFYENGQNINLAIYDKDQRLVGQHFKDEKVEDISSHYDLLNVDKNSYAIFIAGNNYAVKKIKLKDAKQIEVGSILLINHVYVSQGSFLWYCRIFLLIMVLVWLTAMSKKIHYYLVSQSISRKSRRLIIVMIMPLAIYLLLTWTYSFYISSRGVQRISSERAPETLNDNARISSKITSYYITNGSELGFQIYGESNGGNPNQAVVKLGFNTDYFKAKDISFENSACMNTTSKSIDNIKGTIDFTCEINSNNSLNQKPTLIGLVTFNAVKAGIGDIRIIPEESYILTTGTRETLIKQSHSSGELLFIY